LKNSRIHTFSTPIEGSLATLTGKYQGLILVGMSRAVSCQRCLSIYFNHNAKDFWDFGSRMKFKGGYNILLKGRPDIQVKVMPEPDELYLPLRSRRFVFSEISVKDGDRVNSGDILAKDPDNHHVPLLAPRAGVVRHRLSRCGLNAKHLIQRPRNLFSRVTFLVGYPGVGTPFFPQKPKPSITPSLFNRQ